MSKEREIFVQQYSQDVINACEGTGIFPSVAMAQMLIESSDKFGHPGQGITAVRAKNFFGIKASKNWTGPTMAFSTPKDGQPVNLFRVYSSAQDSVADHTKFLIENSRYKTNGVFDAATPEDQARALQKAGYAEGNDGHGGGYADGLIAQINAYNLKALDTRWSVKKK